MIDLNKSDYSNMKAEGRKKLFKAFRKKAFPDRLKNGISFKEFARKHNQWQKKL